MPSKLTFTTPVNLPPITNLVIDHLDNFSEANKTVTVVVNVRRAMDVDHQYALDVRNGRVQVLLPNPYPTAQDPFVIEYQATDDDHPNIATAFDLAYQGLLDGADASDDGFQGLLNALKDLGVVPGGTVEEDA